MLFFLDIYFQTKEQKDIRGIYFLDIRTEEHIRKYKL